MPRARKIGASKTTLRLYSEVQAIAKQLGNGDMTAGLEKLVQHSKESVSKGVCPVCKLPFDKCDYFKSLDND